jgi:hypothetical protein
MQANNLFFKHFWAIENHIENEQLIWIENQNWVVHVEFKIWIEFHVENENDLVWKLNFFSLNSFIMFIGIHDVVH